MAITHNFVSSKPAATDPTQVGSVEWNEAHDVTFGTGAGDIAEGNHAHTGVYEPADATIVKTGNANWIDLTDSGATTLHSHAPDHAAVTLDANADTLLSLSTQALGLDTQAANKVFAGPTTGAAVVPTFRTLVAGDIPALSYGDISGTGVAGQVAEFVTNTKTLQAAKIIGPASNILTITNAAASTLALAITSAKTLTLTAADNYNLTIPATGTAALLGAANVFTNTMQIDGALGIGFSPLSDRKIFVYTEYYSTSEYYGLVIAVNGIPLSHSSGGVYALSFGASHYGSYNMDHAIGLLGNAIHSSTANTTSLIGTAGAWQILGGSSAGVVTNGIGHQIAAPAREAGGTTTVTNAYGIRIYNQGATFITNTYGLYLENQSGSATLNYAIYTNAGLVHFGDSVDLASGKNITLIAGNIITDTTTGTKIGTATTQKLGFWNKTPVVQPAAYTPTNVSADRAYDANSTSLDELADVLGTLIADLQSIGLVG